MSIPESEWPEGALLHSVYTFDDKSKGRWHFLIDTDALPGVSNWCECGSKTAPAFGLAPGTVTARHAAKLDSLRTEVARLQSQSEDERKITGILLAYLGLDESAAFTECGVPNPGRLRSILPVRTRNE